MNDITTAAYSAQPDLSRFITLGLDDVRIGDEFIASVRLVDVLSELAKLKPSSAPYQTTPQVLAPVTGNSSDKITMAALIPVTQRSCALGTRSFSRPGARASA